MSTKAELREKIKRESRIKTGATLDALVDDIVADILTDYCNLARYYELLKEGDEAAAITLVDHQQGYELPDDFNHLAAVRYARGPVSATVPGVYHVIIEQTDQIAQTYRGGYPRFYRLVAGNKISFWPYYDISLNDSLLIDYYIDPNSIYVDDADEFPVKRLEGAVKKDAIARIQRFHSDGQGAQMTNADSAASYNAARGAG